MKVGFLLAVLHNRFVNSARKAKVVASELPGKLTGAVGTSSAIRALLGDLPCEATLMEILGIPAASVSTQITMPEPAARFFFELVMMSGAMANFGEDVRILQSSQFGELTSASSTSSTMAHKRANPITAEQSSGMHTTVIAEYMKIMLNLVSDLQRDLRGSSPKRSYSAVMVYVFQQLKGVKRILSSVKVDEVRCAKNFQAEGYLVMG